MAPLESASLTDLHHALQQRLRCDVRFDLITRTLYSTDASNYQIQPLGVVFPRHDEDLFAIVEAAAELKVPLLPRGSGTSLSGQAVGAALIVDCARHLNRIHHLDPESHQAEVGPGVVGAALNSAARVHGLMFGPDPASADRATFGGMIGNNATGAHSIRYGMTADHLLSAEVILSDGSGASFGSLTQPEAQARADATTLEARIYQASLRVRGEYARVLPAKWPRIWRRASGYSLNNLVGFSPGEPPGWYAHPAPYPPQLGLNLAPLLCGSEGTLAVIRRATVNLVPRPAATVLVVLPFESSLAACEATPAILESRPGAVELIPRSILELARSVPAYSRRLGFVQDIPNAMLVVEYTGESLEAARSAAACVAKHATILESPEAQADLWAVRKAGLGLLLSVPGDVKPISFVEDVAVPVEQLSQYVRRVDRLLAEHGTSGEWYAHASGGCLHLRPLVNLKSASGVAQMRNIAEGILDVVLDLQGVLSGEHGDGLTHTEFNERLFGPEIADAFRQLKQAFDPLGLLNPGKVVTLPGQAPPRMDENLRFGPDYATQDLKTVYAFRREGDLAHAVEACTGVGVCLQTGGVMCPSYQATREEMDTTRGRANALRAAISGRLPPGSLTSSQIYQVLDLCLQCKGCKAECPSAVDMARIKSEYLDLYHQEHGVPLRSRLFAEIASLSRLARPLADPISNLAGLKVSRWVLEKTLKISKQRVMPRFVRTSFRRWFRSRPALGSGLPVVLFVDTFVDYNHPQIGRAAVHVLEAAGYRVLIAPRQVCCGRAMISKGLLQRAKQMAARNLAALAPYAEAGLPIVGLEPSCLLTFRDEYLDFYPDDPRTTALAEKAVLIEELLTQPSADGSRPIDRLRFAPPAAPVLFHGHCQAKALVGTQTTFEMLRATGADVVEIDSGCCGMAGSFGYESEHYDLSMQIGEMRLFPAIREGKGAIVAAAGASCRTQILDGTGVHARHPIEILAEALVDPATVP